MMDDDGLHGDGMDEEEEHIRHRDSIEWWTIGVIWAIDAIGVAVILNLVL